MFETEATEQVKMQLCGKEGAKNHWELRFLLLYYLSLNLHLHV